MKEAGKVLAVRHLGRTRFAEAHRLQQQVLERRIADLVPDTLLLTEHEPVVTLGRGAREPADPGALAGLEVIEVERGGDATWHGPGQVVAYPILALDEGRRDLHRYLRDLEGVVIGVLAELGLRGERRAGATGVWIGERKVASIGVAVRRWVTWHGLALNVDCDLADFRRFRPCGLDPDVMTRLADHLDPAPDLGDVERRLVAAFARAFGYEPVGEPS